jgi:hypothetical protein
VARNYSLKSKHTAPYAAQAYTRKQCCRFTGESPCSVCSPSVVF